MIRKIITTISLHTILVMFLPEISCAQQTDSSIFKIIKPLKEKLQHLRITEVRPTGWLKQQLRENMNGFTGHLDSLAPDLVVADDIYGANRITKQVKSKDVGAISDEGEWQAQFLWWNSETQSNWRDGYIRTAILLDDKKQLQKIRTYINRILATQDADGYIGIYDKELRYKFDNENGELWSKATLMRGLLSWYEYEKDPNILLAVQRAVDNVMANYPIGNSHPFYSTNPYAGGLTHGLAFTDVLERMYQYTHQQQYMDYCLFLYKDFSEQVLHEDAQYPKLMDTKLTLKAHGVHTYEHLRSVAAAYYASGNPVLKMAMQNFLLKISKTITPSGAPVGDEFIGGRNADATTTGYEYCSLLELMDAWLDLLAKTGAADYGDKTELLFFNAAQGARHPTESAICYLKTDNAYFLDGGKNGDTSDKKQTRYRYSPVHKEAAVCCVPNAGRIGPSYIQNMWMKDGNALVATVLGPCELKTKLNGINVSINEITNYPFENSIIFKINIENPASFQLRIRKPAWAETIHCSIAYKLENDFIVLDKKWNKSNSVTIAFDAKHLTKEAGKDEYYFTYGPLVLAHAIAATEKITKLYSIAGLKEIQYKPIDPIIYQYNNSPVSKSPGYEFSTLLYNPVAHKEEKIKLQPMGKTILRQVTFKKPSTPIKP